MEAAINSGAIDLEDTGDSVEVYTNLPDLHRIKEELERSGFIIVAFELFYRPINLVPIDNPTAATQILKLLTTIEERDDVQKVFANFDLQGYAQHVV